MCVGPSLLGRLRGLIPMCLMRASSRTSSWQTLRLLRRPGREDRGRCVLFAHRRLPWARPQRRMPSTCNAWSSSPRCELREVLACHRIACQFVRSFCMEALGYVALASSQHFGFRCRGGHVLLLLGAAMPSWSTALLTCFAGYDSVTSASYPKLTCLHSQAFSAVCIPCCHTSCHSGESSSLGLLQLVAGASMISFARCMKWTIIGHHVSHGGFAAGLPSK